MFKPNNQWKWFFDTNLQCLMLDLGCNGICDANENIFQISVQRKNLTPDAFCESPFTVDDARCFLTYQNAIQNMELSENQKAKLILNAVAAKRFHKPFLPKSWFFHQQNSSLSLLEGSLVELVTESSFGQFIIIENSGNASLCMLAQEKSFALSCGKTMHFCDTIKVMNDRIFVLEQKQGQHTLALVG